jgi:hypothetical protein
LTKLLEGDAVKGKFKATVAASALLSVAVALWFFARSETEFWLKALLPLSAPDLRPLPLILLCTAAWFAVTLPLKRLFKRRLGPWSMWWLFADGFLLLPLPLIANVDVLAADASWDAAFWGGLEEAALWRVLFMVAAFWLWWALSDDRSDFQGSLSSQLLCFPLSAFVPFALAWALMAVAVFGCVTLGLFALLLFKIDTWPLWRAILVGGGNAAGSYVRFFTSLDWHPLGRVAALAWLVITSAALGFIAFNVGMTGKAALIGPATFKIPRVPPKFRGEVGRGKTSIIHGDDCIYVRVNVARSEDSHRWLNVKLLLDTGATYTKLSGRKLRFLGVKPLGTVVETLADGRRIKRKYGHAYIEYDWGRLSGVVPVVFGKDGDAEVLGMTAVRALNLLEEVQKSQAQNQQNQQQTQQQNQPPESESAPEAVVEYKEFAAEDRSEARERINRAGLAAAYLGRNALAGRHVFLPLPYELAKALASGERVAAKDEREKEALERLVLAGFLEGADGGYRVKSEDFERDLKVQVMRLKELFLKRVGGYIV